MTTQLDAPPDAAAPAPAYRPPRALPLIGDLAALGVVLAALLAPDRPSHLSADAVLGLPWELPAGAALALLLPSRAARRVASAAGLVLGLLLVGKLLDLAFRTSLDRPFDPVLDGGLLLNSLDVLGGSIGRGAALAVAVGVVAAAVLAVALVTASARRLARRLTAGTRPTAAVALTAALAVTWTTVAANGASLRPDLQLARDGAVTLAAARAGQVVTAARDRAEFDRETRDDALAAVPADRLLSGLRGKTVIVAFVESYGRSALEDPRFDAPVLRAVDDGTARLAAAGFLTRSAFLTSPTSGGDSWLAHSTLQSGLWIDNEERYRTLLAGHRFTLSGAFHEAGWRTVGVLPGLTRDWPEGRFYGFDQLYDAHNVGYRGPNFSWAPMPDQYVLAAFRRNELAPTATGDGTRRPVMAEMPLVSSHAPWAPLPSAVPWETVGDGSVYDDQPARGDQPSDVWKDQARIRAAYADSVAYTLDTLVSFLVTYGTDDTVVVFLGDHQPAPVVTGEGASRDVPVTVLARDPAVLDRVAGWGWEPGIHPSPHAPVWRMNAFRDRFLTAFS